MAIEWRVLGDPGRDNALFVRIDSGQRQIRLLFDCGQDCVARLPTKEIQSIEHLFFSHLHMDHVAGFDAFFRFNYARADRTNLIWGPPGCPAILHARFQGFWWNLEVGRPATWRVREIGPDRVRTFRYELAELFAEEHFESDERLNGAVLLDDADFMVTSRALEHHGPSLAYLVREKPRLNVSLARLTRLGLTAGPWIERLKADPESPAPLDVNGVEHNRRRLSAEILSETPGRSIAYVTDGRLDPETTTLLADWLSRCDWLVCEAHYRESESELARRYGHITARQAARLACQAGAGRLILIHVSDRYDAVGRQGLLAEAREIFSDAVFENDSLPGGDRDRAPLD